MTKNTFIKKNGIYLIICVCILLIVIICFVTNTKQTIRIEYFYSNDIKDTDFLEPVKDTITDDLWTILNNKMNKEYPDLNFTEEKLKEFEGFITKEEINYYLTNKKFPWSIYVTDRFKQMLISSTGGDPNVNLDELINKLNQNFPNRYAYKQYIKSPAMSDSLTSDQYLIYSGEKPAPTRPP